MTTTRIPGRARGRPQRDDVEGGARAARAPAAPRAAPCSAARGRICDACGADLTARVPRAALVPRAGADRRSAGVVFAAAIAFPSSGGCCATTRRASASAPRSGRQRGSEAERARLTRDARPGARRGPPLAGGADAARHRRRRMWRYAEAQITARRAAARRGRARSTATSRARCARLTRAPRGRARASRTRRRRGAAATTASPTRRSSKRRSRRARSAPASSVSPTGS